MIKDGRRQQALVKVSGLGCAIISAWNLLVSLDYRWYHQIPNLNFDLRGNKMKLSEVNLTHKAPFFWWVWCPLVHWFSGKKLLVVTTMAVTCHPIINCQNTTDFFFFFPFSLQSQSVTCNMVHEICRSTNVCTILLHINLVWISKKHHVTMWQSTFKGISRARDETAHHWQNSTYCDNGHHT